MFATFKPEYTRHNAQAVPEARLRNLLYVAIHWENLGIGLAEAIGSSHGDGRRRAR